MMKSLGIKWSQSFSGYSRNIRLFFIANFLLQFGFGTFMVMYNLYIKSLGFSEKMNGSIISLTAMASVIILIPAGLLSDRIGRKKMLLFGAIFVIITFSVRAIAEDSTFLHLFAFLSGLFKAFVQVSIVPFLAENATKTQRVSIFSYNAAIMMISNMLGNMLGGFLADILQYLNMTEVQSLKITLLVGVLFQVAAIIPILKINELKKEKKPIQFNKALLIKNIRENKGELKTIANYTIAALIIGLGSGLVIPYLNLYFRDRFDASNSLIGIIVSFGQMATAIAMVIGPLVVKKIGEVRSVVFFQLSSIPFLLLTGFTTLLPVAGIGFLIRQALMNAGNPIQQSFIMGKLSDNMKGLANSLQAMVFNLGWALMGPVSTNIVAKGGSYWGYTTVFSITAFLYIIGSIYFYLVFGRKQLKNSGLQKRNLTV